MKFNFTRVVLSSCVLMLVGCAPKPMVGVSPIYAGPPEFPVLSDSIINNEIFKQAPKPHVSTLTYESTELSTQNKFSRYQIHLVKTNPQLITRYRTREVDSHNTDFTLTPGTPIIHGEGVGYGGIFMLAYEKQHSQYQQPVTVKNYYKKYLMTSIGQVSGHLFPLAVGNTLAFRYQDISQNKRYAKPIADQANGGRMVYQVIAHFNRYNGSSNPVPGDIYKIRVSKTTQEDPRLLPQYEYYFSTHLGWYIMARYFKDGKPVAIYRLIDWE